VDKVADPKPFLDSAFWAAVPSLAWLIFAVAVLFWLRAEIRAALSSVVHRIRSGGQVKIGALEIGANSGLVAAPGDFSKEDSRSGVYVDESGDFAAERESFYSEGRKVMLVHRLQRSLEDGQLYDILIYVLPHRGSSLAGVTKVEYFFGSYWHNKVYPSSDRSRGFPVVTSAYGPFLATARVHFNDATTTTLSRYIDFEMGALTTSRARASDG
jgi:hypothetical protein